LTSPQKEVDVYVGSGNIFTLSDGSRSSSVKIPTLTALLTISGSATTQIEYEYSVVGIGLVNLSGISITRKISTYEQIGSGILTLSGQVIYPDIIYIPSPDGSGSISILGSANNSLTKRYTDASGSLFAFYSGFESISRSNYIGLGTIYISNQVSAGSINNPFQIPRTYVVII